MKYKTTKYSSPFVTPPRNSGVSVICNNFVENFNTFNLFSQFVNTDGICSDFFLIIVLLVLYKLSVLKP